MTVITPFKVIQGHWFWYQSKAHMRLVIASERLVLVINTNLHPISHRFEVIADYWSNLRFRQRGTPLWHTRSGWTPKRRITKFGLEKLQTSLCRTVLKYRQIIVWFCHNPRVWQTDGRTDGQTDGQKLIAITCVCVRSRTVKKRQMSFQRLAKVCRLKSDGKKSGTTEYTCVYLLLWSCII